ncbi:MAG: hypothetical protein IKU52_02950 [Clostridia bacterium]|nr:hypothetical protein [Clostridia bacterium]
MTPIEKNIIVVDEQGNEYKATYPKRAKGLVKNGRARFIAENKICLACPPDKIMEDNQMSDNISVNENIEPIAATAPDTAEKLSAKDIFNRISELQRQITENSYYSLHRLGDTFSSIYDHDGVSVASEEIEVICQVFKEREKTLIKMLEIYERMYADLCAGNRETKGIELVKLSVAAELELIETSGLSKDRKIIKINEAIDKGRTRMTDVILRSQYALNPRILEEKCETSKAPESEVPQESDQ